MYFFEISNLENVNFKVIFLDLLVLDVAEQLTYLRVSKPDNFRC